MTTIFVEHVSKTIKHNLILNDINLELKSGFIHGFRGINGSGKTMLMRALSGLISPSKGTIRFNDQVLGKDLDFPPSIGVLIENPAFIEYLSGFDNLMFIADIKRKISRDEIRAVLRRVGLDPDDRKKYRHYSLGMKQRLGIAAAIMESPDVVILDEPTNALDTDGIAMVRDIVCELKARGTLVLLSCHDFDFLNSLSDNIYRIEQGAIVSCEAGKPYKQMIAKSL